MKELDTPYKTWLNEDVVYIISPEERSTFFQLATNEEREHLLNRSGSGGAATRICRITTSKKNTIDGLRTPTSICFGNTGMEDGPRTDIYHLGQARRKRIAPDGRNV